MKKIFVIVAVASATATISAQKTPPRPHHPPHHRGDLPAPPDAPPRPLTPKEVWQKMHEGKKKADAKRDQDLREMEAADRKAKKK